MTHANRRSFIRQTSVATAAALAVIPGLALPRVVSSPSAPPPPAPTLSEPLAAYVRDATTGEIALLIGTQEVVVHDLSLVARLVQAAR